MSQNNEVAAPATDAGTKFVSPVTSALEVVNDPTAHGFEWYAAPIHHKKVCLSTEAPRVKVTDLDTFVEKFGSDLVLSCVNGTSLDVKVETVVRDLYDANRTAKVEDVRLAVVNRVLLGNRTRTVTVKTITVETIVYTAMDGSKHGTEIEAKQHNLGLMIDNGVSLAQAKMMLGITE